MHEGQGGRVGCELGTGWTRVECGSGLCGADVEAVPSVGCVTITPAPSMPTAALQPTHFSTIWALKLYFRPIHMTRRRSWPTSACAPTLLPSYR
eukprot:361245-Chlamydomonas_euryale.AAC.2